MFKRHIKLTTIKLLKKEDNTLFILSKKTYVRPENRWSSYFKDEYEINRLEYTYIENMTMTQPYEPLYYHEQTFKPDDFTPSHINDPRYNYNVGLIPEATLPPLRPLKLYNYHCMDAMMHGTEWRDFQPDYQVEHPMDSNHYYQATGPLRALFAFILIFIFTIGKIFIFFITINKFILLNSL